MSRQLALSACVSIFAMAGLALAAPVIEQRTSPQAHADANEMTVQASLLSVGN